jgi:hypothetical protein
MRATLIGFALLIVMAVAAFYAELKWHSVDHFAAGVPSTASVLVLVILGAAMWLPLFRRNGLSRRELLTIYSIVLVGGPLVSSGILLWMIPHHISYYFMAQVNPLWEETFIQYLPRWYAPTSWTAIRGFFEGGVAVPWSEWWVPLGAWTSFMLALFVASFCLLALIARQWITNERLSFPLAQIPLSLLAERSGEEQAPAEGGGGAARLTSLPMFWAGAGIALVIAFANTLSTVAPSFPSIPTGPVPLLAWRNVGPLAGLGEIDLVLWPWMIGLAYLVPKELSLSIWLFWAVRLALSVAGIAAGATPERPEEMFGSAFPAPYFQGGGAVFALGIWALWLARRHVAHAAAVVLGRADAGGDKDEPLPYRLACVGAAVSVAWLIGFCIVSGARPLFAAALVAMILGYYVMWARLRAEAGLGFLDYPLEIENATMTVWGNSAFRPGDIITLISTRWSWVFGAGSSFEVCPGSVLEAFKIADVAHIRTRPLSVALLTGFVLSLVVSVFVVMVGCYRYGYLGLAITQSGHWLAPQTREEGARIFEHLTVPSRWSSGAVIGVVAGAAVVTVLGILRARFWWWPLHPLGYVAANTWGMQLYYMPFLVGWACKSLVIRYGGLRLYRQLMPLALGLIVGQLLNSGLWIVLAALTNGAIAPGVSLGTD